MDTNLFIGSEDGREIFLFLDKEEYSQLDDYKDLHLKFMKKVKIIGDIVSWSPFLAILKKEKKNITFCCPSCGCISCERENKHHADPYFWQGYYKCSRCGAKGFSYYSEAFQFNKDILKFE